MQGRKFMVNADGSTRNTIASKAMRTWGIARMSESMAPIYPMPTGQLPSETAERPDKSKQIKLNQTDQDFIGGEGDDLIVSSYAGSKPSSGLTGRLIRPVLPLLELP
jgi:hypothetical protein